MSKILIGLLTLALSAGFAPASAQENALTLKTADIEAPSEVSKSIRDALETQTLQLVRGDTPVLEFWLRKEVPLKSAPGNPEEALKSVSEGTVLGVVRLHEDRRDFRDDSIPKGVYTLRFALQPQDGDHMGTAPVPYFVLLMPVDVDKALDGPEARAAAVAYMKKSKHPRNLNLRPAESEESESARIEEGFDETRILQVRLSAKTEGGEQAVLPLGLVFEGHGEI